jgi:NAD(P)-dependent dehydrogenase (short-subunit alcohol dehydrogenase family)
MSLDIDALFSVRGKSALVTGATSGIGFMIAEGLLRAGARVYACARNPEGVVETQNALGDLGELHIFVGDVGTSEGVDAIVQEVSKHDERLHILVNNVGATARAPFEDYPREEFDRVLNINITAPFDLTRRCHSLLRAAASEADPARVINISSIGAFKLMEGVNNFAYTSSKAGLIMLTRHLAAELVKDHINVNTIAPGLFESKLAGYMFDPSHPQYHTRPNIPIDRPGVTEDMVGAVIYLSSRAGSFVTGAMIPVSGGQSTIDWGR